VAAQIHVEVLVRHREHMKNCADSLRTIEFLRKRLVVIAHRDHAFTGIATGSPIEITLMSGDGWRQAIFAPKKSMTPTEKRANVTQT
jgi:hypothetical protein